MRNNRRKTIILMLAISVTLLSTSAGCGKENTSNSDSSPAVTNNGGQPEGPSSSAEIPKHNQPETEVESTDPGTKGSDGDSVPSLEQVSAKDGGKFLDALKQQDTKALSGLMAHAENEYTESDMVKVLEGFQLYFDRLEELKLRYESNEQNKEYYVEHYAIAGKKDNQEYSIPFIIKYSKSQNIEHILNDDQREPIFDSPLIEEYPNAVRDAERYVQALQQKDMESLALHLEYDELNEQTKAAVEQMLTQYDEALDLSSLKPVPLGYDEQEEQFLFELQDADGRKHNIRIDVEDYTIIDEWA
ncbi:hypothetical protein [Paenibacillus tarimensis]|uniref:hypothetical protein n=1 Tax=Paenibacillus tarimensis TaxID=416012 RepID=UPI001F3EB9FB|nr:hypothetical protein [Paenibacillus tarimensis]MCF2946349.1 hypothetical protein [Paenibacillus tarimensis]